MSTKTTARPRPRPRPTPPPPPPPEEQDECCRSADHSHPPPRAGGTIRRVGEGEGDDDFDGRWAWADSSFDDDHRSIIAGDDGRDEPHRVGGDGGGDSSERWRDDDPRWWQRRRKLTEEEEMRRRCWPPECEFRGDGGESCWGGGASESTSSPPRPGPGGGGPRMWACVGFAALFGAVLLLAVAAPVPRPQPQVTERTSGLRWQQQRHPPQQRPPPPPRQRQYVHPAMLDSADAVAAGVMERYHHRHHPATWSALERRNLQSATDDSDLGPEVPEMTDGGQSERLRRDLLSGYDRGSYPWEHAWMQSGWIPPPSDDDNNDNSTVDDDGAGGGAGGGDATTTTNNNNTSDVLREGLIVNVGINFHRVYAVDVVSSEADLIVWFRQSWVDPRLSWNPDDYGGLKTIWFYIGDGVGAGETSEIWTPDLQLWNMGLSLQASLTDSYANVNNEGLVWWSRPGHLRPVCKFRGLDDFPFDTLACTMEIGSWAYSGLYLRPTMMAGTGFSIGGSETAGASYAEFSLRGVACREHVYPPYPALPEEDWPVLLYEVTFSRSWQPYTRGYLTLQIVLNLAGFACFWMPVQSGERVALAITALLAAVASELVVAARIPSAAELTWFQIFSIVSLAFASICLFESVAVVYFFYYTKDDLVPDWMRWVWVRILCRSRERLNKRVSAASRAMSGGAGRGGGGSRILSEAAEEGSGESDPPQTAGRRGSEGRQEQSSPGGRPRGGGSRSDSDDFHPDLCKKGSSTGSSGGKNARESSASAAVNGSSASLGVRSVEVLHTKATATSAAADDDADTVNGDVPTAVVGVESGRSPPRASGEEEAAPPRPAPPPRRAMPPRSVFREPSIGTNASTRNLNCSELTMNPVQRNSLRLSNANSQRRGGIMRSHSAARDADDFHDQRQATNNRYWQGISGRIDEVARAIVPLAYAVAIGILVNRIR